MTDFETQMMEQFSKINQRFDKINQSFDDIDKCFDAIDKRFDAIDKRFDDLEEKFDYGFRNVNERQVKMQQTMQQYHDDVVNAITELAETMGGMIDENGRRITTLEQQIM